MESIKRVETISRRRRGRASRLAEKSSFRYLLKAIRHKSESRPCSAFRDSKSNGPRGLLLAGRRNNFCDIYAKCVAIRRATRRAFPLNVNPQELREKSNGRNSAREGEDGKEDTSGTTRRVAVFAHEMIGVRFQPQVFR